MSIQARQGYTATQIGLHWIIAAIVIFQLVFGESMNFVVRAIERGTVPTPSEQLWGDLHYWAGWAILGLVAIRLAIRLSIGAPASIQRGWMDVAAQASHTAFYVMLVAMPVLGLLGYYLGDPWAEIHTWGKPVFIVLIGLHACAALYHQFWLKDGTLRRILVPTA